MFWVRRRWGTRVRVRLPVTAWPEIAAWVMMGTRQIHAGKQQPSRSARARLKPAAMLRLLLKE